MNIVKPLVVSFALLTTLTLTGCAPATPSGGSAPAASASPGTSPNSGAKSSPTLKLIDVCAKIPVTSMASLLGRPYAEIQNSTDNARESGCDYDGAGGVASLLDLKVSMQSGASQAGIDKILASLGNDGENPVQIHGMGDYAGAVKDVVAALYGTTAVIAVDSNHPNGMSDLTTAQLRQVVSAIVAAAG